MNGRLWWIMSIVAVGLIGCVGPDVLGPADPSSGTAELLDGGVRVTLTVTPGDVTRPGEVMATLRYRNETSHPVVVTSSAGCLSFAAVYRGNTRIPFPATEYFCTAAITSREVAPGTEIGMDWPLGIGESLVPGTYRFVADLNTHARDLERTFVVR
jgi:hypothetical protein